METIRNYLETMFSNLPNTPEFQKAKYELWQMMEDKYSELIEQGKTDNEAVGIVIAEFGNLDELAGDLGIGNFVHQNAPDFTRRQVSMDEAGKYLAHSVKYAYTIALGVLLCIISPTMAVLADGLETYMHFNSSITEAVGGSFLFIIIAIAVALFIFAGLGDKNWSYLKNQPCTIDFATAKFVHDRRESYKMTHALLLTIGVMLCILSFIPAIVIDSFHPSGFMEEISGIFFLAFVGIGVFMIVLTCTRISSFDTLLGLNNSTTMGGNFVPSQNEQRRYNNSVIAGIMSVYWPTVTCIYLCWSFLTFDWHITWIIWPVTAIIDSLVKNTLGE